MDIAQFQAVKQYVDFDAADCRALQAFAPLASTDFLPIVDDFYTTIERHPSAAAVIVGGEEQVQRLKQSLLGWLQELLTGPYDGQYLEAHSRIGRVHVRIGLPQELMLTAMNRIRLGLLKSARRQVADTDELTRTITALHRVIDLELAIMLDTYRLDWLERVRVSERLATLEESERFNREVIDRVPAFVIALDEHGRIVLWNRNLEETTGYSAEVMVGELGDHLIDSSEPQPLAVLDGDRRMVRWRRAATAYAPGPERDFPRKLTYAIGVDVTEELETQRSRRRAERLAAVGTMAAGLAHEVRNPLNSASLQLGLLERRAAKESLDPGWVAKTVGAVQGEIQRLDRLVSDFLAFAKPQPLQLVPTDLPALVESIASFLRFEAREAGVDLSTETTVAESLVPMDGQRVKQAIINLARNAIQAAPAGGHVVLRVRHDDDGSTTAVEVEDDGPGFSNDEPLFDAFYTTKEGGTGLGLALVHSVATEHGGRISAHSDPTGTRFCLTFPSAATTSHGGSHVD